MLAPQTFQKKLSNWYEQYGRKNLPWQQEITPYRVWLSEVMLQQTQVSTVIPYFEKFIQTFPDIFDLAKAPQDEVLRLWAGLGYYSRARNLHKTAQIIVNNYQGEFPNNLDSLKKLPGIGRSTAGAILSFGFQQRAPILDGNVKRVLVRIHAIHGFPESSKILKQLWAISDQYTPEKQIERYNQAMMDLGSLICTRTKPKCDQCPFQKNCQAFSQKIQHELPSRKSTKKVPLRKTFMLILRNNRDEVLLTKRPLTGIWGGLWSFPESDVSDIALYAQQKLGIQIIHQKELPDFTHKFTHFSLKITPILCQINPETHQLMESEHIIWHNIGQELPVGVPKPATQILNQLKRSL